MACSRVSTRVTNYTLIILFSFAALSLEAGRTEFGLEITYTDSDKVTLFLSGSYKTDYAIGTISINPIDVFPDNIIINVTPIVNRSSNQKELISALAGITDGTFNLGKYLLKRKFCQNKELEKHLINSYLKKHKKNLQLLKESSHD